MKKVTILVALVLILALIGCACQAPSGNNQSAGNKQELVSQTAAEEETMASNAGATTEETGKQNPVSQDEVSMGGQKADPKETSVASDQSEAATRDQAGDSSDRTGNRVNSDPTPDFGQNQSSQTSKPAEQTAPVKEQQPSASETKPAQQPETPPQAPKQETPAVTEPVKTPEPAPEEPSTPKSIYDYEFDVEAIRSELIALGQSMGLTHITSDDGVACTPENCSWASPITASQSLQGENLKRALQSYVSSMPSIVSSYGGGQLEYFTIYVRSNGGGSYTFYFLY